MPTFYLSKEDGSVEAAVDSTPLIRRFERDYDERKVIPPDPAIAFLDYRRSAGRNGMRETFLHGGVVAQRKAVWSNVRSR